MKKSFTKKIIYQGVKFLNPLISNTLFTNLLFKYNSIRLNRPGYKLNLKKPKTFNEKISYIKFNERNKLAPIVADKFAVREYIKNTIGEKYLIPLLNVFYSIDEIDITTINVDCILKMNNGSGANLIIRKEDSISNMEVKKFFKNAFLNDVYLVSREWHYPLIKPCIIVEELIDDNITDYKFFCSNNQPFAIQVDVDRYINHKRNIYDLDWNLLPFDFCYSNANYKVPKPQYLTEMIEVAKKLSKDFNFARIDLYESKGKVWFGEITLHPEGGVGPFSSYDQDLKFGKYLS